ncbi:MAG: AMP-binding protein [Pseudomonadota bacterium]
MSETTTAVRVPLTTRPLDASVAWHGTRPITVAELLADAGALSRSLPPRGVLINACANRYAFLVGFLAALLRGRVCLLPGERTPQRFALLRRAYPDSELLTDAGADGIDGAIGVPILTGAALRDDPQHGPAADRVVSIAFTSGSTGEPLGHARRWGALMWQIEAIARRFDLLGPETVAIAATVPHSHMYGFETTILLPLRAAVAVHAGTPLYPDDVRRVLAGLPAPRLLVTSPVHLRALADSGSDQALPPVRTVISATAPLSTDLATRVETRLATSVLEIYGCTEAGSVASRRTLAEAGWRAFDGLTVAEAPGTTGSAQVDVAGEPHPLPLNDVLTFEPDGTFRLLGRREDMIKVGGKRASLAALTAHLLGIDGVQDGMMVMPDATGSDDAPRPCAIVVAPTLTPRAILDALRRRVDPVFVPRRVVLVEALPRDALGKLPKARLAALLGTASEPVSTVTLQIPPDHPSLVGHFPGQPLVPGVVLLDAIARAARTAFDLGALDGLPRAKFVRPVGGGAPITLALRRTAVGQVAYEARLDGELVAAGDMTFAEAGAR